MLDLLTPILKVKRHLACPAQDSADNPHISYYDWSNGYLKYARLDARGRVGEYSSMMFDPRGNPHIAYFDSDNQSLKYAFWNGEEWLMETVDHNGPLGLHASLALDSAGRPHISCCDPSSRALMYAVFR